MNISLEYQRLQAGFIRESPVSVLALPATLRHPTQKSVKVKVKISRGPSGFSVGP